MLFSTVAASISIPTSSVEGSVFTPSSAFLSLVFVLIALLTSVRASLVAQLKKNLPAMQETWVQSLSWEDSLERGMATYSSILASRIPWTEETGGL